MSHVDRNNPRTVAELREHIGKLANSPNESKLNSEYSFQLGWIGALWWANRIDRDMHEALTAELDAAARAWTLPPAVTHNDE